MTGLVDFWNMIWPTLGEGLWVTLQLSIGSLLIGLAVGFPLALARVYGPKGLKFLATAFTDVFRGTPLLVQLFFIYYGLADPGLNSFLEGLGLGRNFLVLPPMTAAYLALGLNSAAYQAEYFRGAVQAIGSGQMLAARALGMSRVQGIIHIVMPQALRIVIAPWSNEAAYMVKYTSVVSFIAVADLFGKTRQIMSRHYNQMTMLPFVGLVYLAIVLVITFIMHRLEKMAEIPGLEADVNARL